MVVSSLIASVLLAVVLVGVAGYAQSQLKPQKIRVRVDHDTPAQRRRRLR